MATGIFFHYQQGERLRDFPQALNGILDKDNICYFDSFYPSKPETDFDIAAVPMEALYKIHTPKMVDRVKSMGVHDGALHSVSGTLAAAEKVWSGELVNAFVFTGYGDHHAGSHFCGGGCYYNGAAIAINELEERFGAKRFAVIDTDAHHGDGSWELFDKRPNVLYICFCAGQTQDTNQNVNIHVPYMIDEATYLSIVEDVFRKRLKSFRPEIVFWNWGYDGTIGEYGDMGLGPEFQISLAEVIKKSSDEVCEGSLVVVLCGGSRRDLAAFLIPRIIRVLASL
ncbi:MAG: hypothetical protein V2J25_09875 [Desulfatiglans sp.]|nr:hypothetical protein [Thermodesulfobacteriota bacterium]MEE4353166.1 hypothetical protein [Desulfatiglans sp.]